MVQKTIATLVAHKVPHSISYAFLNSFEFRSVRHYAPAPASGRLPQMPPLKVPPQKSLQVSFNDQSRTEMPHDLGILPG